MNEWMHRAQFCHRYIYLPLPNGIKPNVSSTKAIQHLTEVGSVRRPWETALYVHKQRWASYMLPNFLNALAEFIVCLLVVKSAHVLQKKTQEQSKEDKCHQQRSHQRQTWWTSPCLLFQSSVGVYTIHITVVAYGTALGCVVFIPWCIVSICYHTFYSILIKSLRAIPFGHIIKLI